MGLIRSARELAKLVTEINSKVHKPKTYNEAVHNPIHGKRGKKAIDEELWNLDSYQIWYYIILPPNRKLIGCKWVFKVKYNPDKSIKKCKARLVTQGFSQVYVINYTETFMPAIRQELLQIFLAIATMLE